MEAKLAEFRSRKKAVEEKKKKTDQIWNILTLKFLRQTTSSDSNIYENSNAIDSIEQASWSKIDYAILSVKILMWLVILIQWSI